MPDFIVWIVVIPTPKSPEFGADVNLRCQGASHFKLQSVKVTWLYKALLAQRVLVVGIRMYWVGSRR